MLVKFLNPIYFILVLSLYFLCSTSEVIAEVELNQDSKKLVIAQQNKDDDQEEIEEEEEEEEEEKKES